MNTHRHPWTIVGACALAAAATACSSGTPASSGSTTTPAASSPAASSPAASSPAASPGTSSPAAGSASAVIAANWTAFFANSTPVAKRVSLLEDGSQFASIIQAQAGSGLAASASAKVLSVTQTSSSQATVNYDILAAGAVALPNQTGIAVLQNGTWKVGVKSFCGLLGLEGLKKLPAACASAG
jgi:hypothetical protein